MKSADALLREHRRAAGLTQRQLADAAGVSIGVIRDLEQGRTARLHARSAQTLVRALGLDRDLATRFTEATCEPPADGLRLAVLGPLEAWRAGVPVALGPPGLRAVLALLAVSVGELVHRDTIVDALWGADCPPTAVNQVQAYVSRLRQELDPGRSRGDHGGVLTSTGTSYTLRATADELDLLSFTDLVHRAETAVTDPAEACALYERAMDLWRGNPLVDVERLRQHPAVAGLSQLRSAILVDYAETACRAGRYPPVIKRLWLFTQEEPLHERAHALLMIALAASGQQAAALRMFEELRLRLDTELGVRPGPELAEAQVRVLRGDVLTPPAKPAPAREPASGTAKRAAGGQVPRQLPAPAPHFAGRAAQLTALNKAMRLTARGHGTVVITAIKGMAGVGKTALAVFWAHQAASRFPDGQLYVNLRGFDPSGEPCAPAEVLQEFLAALGLPPERIPPSPDTQLSLYRTLMTDKRMLIVLDNARDEDQVRPLLPGGAGCLVIVTSRKQLMGLIAADGAQPVALDVLTEEEARDMLRRRLGAQRVRAEPEAVAELIGSCSGLPLALSIVAARAAVHPQVSLASLAAELRHVRLDALETNDLVTSPRSVFSWSYENLSTQAARMFRLLSLHPGPDASVASAASLTGTPCGPARQALDELIRTHLVTEHTPGRFAFHDLVRSYAREQADRVDSPAEQHAAIQRMLDHYLRTAYAAALHVDPSRPRLTLPAPHPGAAVEPLADPGRAMEWLEAERPVLLGAASAAVAAGMDRHAWQICSSLTDFLDLRGHWQERADTQNMALAAAERIGDVEGQACASRELGRIQLRLGRYPDAHAHLSLALSLYRHLGDDAGQGAVCQTLGRYFELQNRYSEALAYSQRALHYYQAARHQAGQARAFNAVGWQHALLGDYQQSLSACQQALGLYGEIGDRRGAGNTWDSLGYAHYLLGDYREAVAAYQRALGLFQELHDRYSQTVALTHLGDAHDADRQPQEAGIAWRRALDLLEELHLPEAEQVRAKLNHIPVPGSRSGPV